MVALVAGCGDLSDKELVSYSRLPIVRGARVTAVHYNCYAPELCWRFAVLIAPPGITNESFASAEFTRLLAAGWRRSRAVGRRFGARSGDGRLFISFDTGPREIAQAKREQASAPDLEAMVRAHRQVLASTLEKSG
jgi:hypothetical protein